MAPPRTSASSGARPRFTFSGIVLRALLLFLFLEGLARVWLHQLASPEDFLKYAALDEIPSEALKSRTRFQPHRYIGYTLAPDYQEGRNLHNALGFRGEAFPQQKPPGEFRIVCMGASTTYASFTGSTSDEDYRSSYPYQLQARLQDLGYHHVRVINAGTGGWSSWESLVNLQFRLLPLSPDLLILYEGINDVRTRMVWPPEAYQADNSGFTRENFYRNSFPLWEHSTLLRSILVATGHSEPQASFARLVNPENRDHSFSKEFLRQQHKGIYPSGLFQAVPAMQMLDHNPPVYFERNIASAIDIARANRIQVILADFAFDSTNFPEYPSSSSPEFIRGIREHNAVLRELARSRQVLHVDFNDWIPKDRQHFADGHHFTAKGAQVLASRLAQYIDAQQLIPRESGP